MIRELLIKLRNRVLWWFGTVDVIDGLNTNPELDKATFNTVLFHWIMKEPLRKIIKLMPDIPQSWIDNLTGSQRLLYEIAKECWYDCDKSGARREQLWKPFLFVLIYWHQDEAAEPFDRVLYEVLRRRDEFYIWSGRLDPANWYMEHNPAIPMNESNGRTNGRRLHISLEDPAVRYDTLHSPDTLVLLERPGRSFVCLRDAEGKPQYTLFNRFEYVKLPTGGYQYRIIGRTGSLYEATNMAESIETGGN